MATGDGVGWRTISVTENSSHTITEIIKRQVYWARYIDVSILVQAPDVASGGHPISWMAIAN